MICRFLALFVCSAVAAFPFSGFAQQGAPPSSPPPSVSPLAPPSVVPAPEKAVDVPNFRDSLRDIVRTLSDYARSRNPRFIVLTRGGLALAVMQVQEAKRQGVGQGADGPAVTAVGSVVRRYVRSFDGVVMDGQFCGSRVMASEAFIGALKDAGLSVLSVDWCETADSATHAYEEARRIGIIAQVGVGYGKPDRMPMALWGENSENVSSLAEAKNFALLETANDEGNKAAWISALRESNADMLVIFPFWRAREALSAAEVAQLKTKKMGARRLVLARMNISYARDTDYYWKESWKLGKPSWIVAPVSSTPGEVRVDYRNREWQAIVGRTFAGLLDLGFDGVVIEGVEAYQEFEKEHPFQ